MAEEPHTMEAYNKFKADWKRNYCEDLGSLPTFEEWINFDLPATTLEYAERLKDFQEEIYIRYHKCNP